MFGMDNVLGATKANNKNTNDVTNAQIRNPSEVINGYSAMIKKTIKKTMPKDFGEDRSASVAVWLVSSDI
tara:strand:+ start:579 stop:788 length:210 start_codon:yes stop_codon:yes gene_type:complete